MGSICDSREEEEEENRRKKRRRRRSEESIFEIEAITIMILPGLTEKKEIESLRILPSSARRRVPGIIGSSRTSESTILSLSEFQPAVQDYTRTSSFLVPWTSMDLGTVVGILGLSWR